ncbi:MAG: DUF2934 domain-containing protein [Thiohalocapsa sp.]|nr:DUF2934 domain-containing protein [Thiohalocapsa sp.]MCF7989553.1 DUF2934 domain-containing protein [Thiohalocapsa sp.]
MPKAKRNNEPDIETGANQSSDTSTETVDVEQMIAEAAYYKAQQRRFAPGSEMDDWLDAEREITARHAEG